MTVIRAERIHGLLDEAMTPEEGQIVAWNSTTRSWEYRTQTAGQGSIGPPGTDGRSIAVFEQPTEPMAAIAGDLWIVP